MKKRSRAYEAGSIEADSRKLSVGAFVSSQIKPAVPPTWVRNWSSWVPNLLAWAPSWPYEVPIRTSWAQNRPSWAPSELCWAPS